MSSQNSPARRKSMAVGGIASPGRREGLADLQVNAAQLQRSASGSSYSSGSGSGSGRKGHKGRRHALSDEEIDAVVHKGSINVDAGAMQERALALRKALEGEAALEDDAGPARSEGFNRSGAQSWGDADEDDVSLDSEEIIKKEATLKRAEARKHRCRNGLAFILKFGLKAFCFSCKFIFERCRRSKQKQAVAKNNWIQLPDRPNRVHRLRQKRKELLEKMKQEERDSKSWYIKVLFNVYKRQFLQLGNDLWNFIYENVFGRVDVRTGLPARLLETWELQELVHEGPHGWVYKAVDKQGTKVAVKVRDKSRGHVLQLPLDIAIKTLRKEGVTKHRFMLLHRLLVRLGISRTLNHPHLVHMYAVLDNQEFFVEVCEWCAGGSLSGMIEDMDQQLDEHQACQVFAQLLAGLRYLHQRRLVHRDVRLSQVLLSKSGRVSDVKLGDFWCMARVSKKRGVLVSSALPGDVATLAPEVLKCGEWSDKADVWAAGCMLFELLYGHPPYGGEGEALMERICTLDPEFDSLCESSSDNAKELLRMLLRRKPHLRPGVKDVLHHKWLVEFGTKEKSNTQQGLDHKIRRVKVDGKPPIPRRGMSVDNLLSAKTGMFNAGFCTLLGSLQCQMDFEIGGPEDTQMYWLSSVLVSFWGTQDNPHSVTMLAALRQGGLYSEIQKIKVGSADDFEARLVANKPIRYLRLGFRDNFGGIYGIALRKLTFYGYPVKPISVIANLDKALYTKGAEAYSHTEELKEGDINKEVHKSLRAALTKGNRIQGTGSRYMKYRDVHSGPTHTTTSMGIYVNLQPGMKLIAASLALRYMARIEPLSTPPRLRINVETQEGKIVIFSSGELKNGTIFKSKEILSKGYDELEPLYADSFEISTNEPFLLEVQFENNSGYVHIPTEFGLTFYHVPDVPLDTSDSDEENHQDRKNKSAARGRRAGTAVTDVEAIQNLAEDGAHAKVEAKDDEEDEDAEIEDYNSDTREVELEKDMKELTANTTFGAWGASQFDAGDIQPWQPASKKSFMKGAPQPPQEEPGWWEGSSTVGSGSESLSEGSGIQEHHRKTRRKKAGSDNASESSKDSTMSFHSGDGSFETGTTTTAPATADMLSKAASSRTSGANFEGLVDAWSPRESLRRQAVTEKDEWLHEDDPAYRRAKSDAVASQKARDMKRARQEERHMQGISRAAARKTRKQEAKEAKAELEKAQWQAKWQASEEDAEEVPESGAKYFVARASVAYGTLAEAANRRFGNAMEEASGGLSLAGPRHSGAEYQDDTLLGRLLCTPPKLRSHCLDLEQAPGE